MKWYEKEFKEGRMDFSTYDYMKWQDETEQRDRREVKRAVVVILVGGVLSFSIFCAFFILVGR